MTLSRPKNAFSVVIRDLKRSRRLKVFEKAHEKKKQEQNETKTKETIRHPAQASGSFPVNWILRIKLREIFIVGVYVFTTLTSEPSKGHYGDVMQSEWSKTILTCTSVLINF